MPSPSHHVAAAAEVHVIGRVNGQLQSRLARGTGDPVGGLAPHRDPVHPAHLEAVEPQRPRVLLDEAPHEEGAGQFLQVVGFDGHQQARVDLGPFGHLADIPTPPQPFLAE